MSNAVELYLPLLGVFISSLQVKLDFRNTILTFKGLIWFTIKQINYNLMCKILKRRDLLSLV